MKNRNRAVAYRNHLLCSALAAICLASVAASVARAKSLYVITQILNLGGETPVRAYDIGPGGLLTYQTEYGVRSRGGGTVGLAIDSLSESLFVTYEGSNEIQVLDATTLKEDLVAAAPGAVDLAGIVYDHDKQLLYTVDRAEPNLYVYRWDPTTGHLNNTPGSPFHLSGAEAYGIALDEIDDQLYVGNGTRDVTVYTTADWSLVRTISLHRGVISVAVDPKRGYLYTGGGFADNFYLTQYNLATGKETEVQVDPEAGVMGLGVDPTTGRIYVTTGRNNKPGGDDLLVFDMNLTQIQAVEDIGNPTGLAIPGKETSYNPLHLVKTVEQASAQPSPGTVPEVPIGGEFTYDICFDHDGYALTDITLLDTLPLEVEFVRADGDGVFGQYDSQTHTYLWRDPPLSGGPRTCLKLVARVKPEIAPGALVLNSVTIDTAQTPPTTITVDAVAAVIVQPFKPLDVTKTVVGGFEEPNDPTHTLFVNPGDRITYKIIYGNEANTQAVTNVTVVDALPTEVDFVEVRDRIGQYNASMRTCMWTIPSLPAGQSGFVELVVQVKNDVAGGTRITNHVTVDSDEPPVTSTSADVVVALEVLQLTKRIKSGASEDPKTPGRFLTSPGANITYEICISNPSTTRTVTDISIVDTLPGAVTFLSAEREREIGDYDATNHTFTWTLGSLAPGTQDCLDLVVHVPQTIEPNTVISNSVTANTGQTPQATTRVDVIVPEEPPVGPVVYCDLLVKPTKLYRDLPKQPTSLMAVVHMPEGWGNQMIAKQPLTLQPGDIPALSQRIFGTSTAGAVMAFFDPQALLAATPVNGSLTVKVNGKLTDGRTFQGQQNIEIYKSSK
jgi:uncharacterized repeat protein (TIGR01451 family)